MNDVRLNLTNDERIAQTVLSGEGQSFNMAERDINKIIEKENAKKFNSELEKYVEEMNQHTQALSEISANMGADPEKLEIKPMKDHMLIKPFEKNPFQQMKVKDGLIIDTGGFKAGVDLNPVTGKYEEQVPVIITACVMEVGPEVTYIKQGDVVFYHRRNAIPVPFFKQGFYDLGEYHVLAVVNEGLTERFNNIVNDGKQNLGK